jgi:hypothetical protein
MGRGFRKIPWVLSELFCGEGVRYNAVLYV